MPYVRTQVYLEPDQHRALKDEAHRRGMSLAHLLREIVDEARGDAKAAGDLTSLIGVAGTGEPSDVSRHKDEYISQAVSEHRRRAATQTSST